MTDTTRNPSSVNGDLPPVIGTRYTLASEEELRLEVPFHKQSTCTLVLQHGSCELWGVELVLGKPIVLAEGGLKIALFTWHGCVVDVQCEPVAVDICYTTDETACNVAFVNTHAQLEALRDQAAAALATSVETNNNNSNHKKDGPRVLICGPPECGKSTLCKILTAYACKLGRTPILVDLDPQDAGLISVPGTIGACPMSLNSISFDSFATATGIPPGTTSPLLFWHGQDVSMSSKSLSTSNNDKQESDGKAGMPLQPELFRAQVNQLATRINQRLTGGGDDVARASGLIVNTNGWIEAEGFELLLHAIAALRIDVVLVLGHDRLYSMIKSKLASKQQAPENAPKIIKLPRSGGVVSRGSDYLRRSRNRSIKQYFYGTMVDRPATEGGATTTKTSTAVSSRVPQLTPFLLQIPMDQVTIYKFSSIRLSASLLPVASAQTTEAIQLVPILHKGKLGSGDDDDVIGGKNDAGMTTPSAASDERAKSLLQHHLLAICHRHAVQAYEASGQASDLYLAGVAGFCAVERIIMDKLHLLSPCAGSLPSNVLLMGNIMWME